MLSIMLSMVFPLSCSELIHSDKRFIGTLVKGCPLLCCQAVVKSQYLTQYKRFIRINSSKNCFLANRNRLHIFWPKMLKNSFVSQAKQMGVLFYTSLTNESLLAIIMSLAKMLFSRHLNNMPADIGSLMS